MPERVAVKVARPFWTYSEGQVLRLTPEVAEQWIAAGAVEKIDKGQAPEAEAPKAVPVNSKPVAQENQAEGEAPGDEQED